MTTAGTDPIAYASSKCLTGAASGRRAAGRDLRRALDLAREADRIWADYLQRRPDGSEPGGQSRLLARVGTN